jgi:hypothetical protein
VLDPLLFRLIDFHRHLPSCIQSFVVATSTTVPSIPAAM